jgi:hypothetical protein
MSVTKSVLMLCVAAAATAGMGIFAMFQPTTVKAFGCKSSNVTCLNGSGYCNGHPVGNNCQCNVSGSGQDDGKDCQSVE